MDLDKHIELSRFVNGSGYISYTQFFVDVSPVCFNSACADQKFIGNFFGDQPLFDESQYLKFSFSQFLFHQEIQINS